MRRDSAMTGMIAGVYSNWARVATDSYFSTVKGDDGYSDEAFVLSHLDRRDGPGAAFDGGKFPPSRPTSSLFPDIHRTVAEKYPPRPTTPPSALDLAAGRASPHPSMTSCTKNESNPFSAGRPPRRGVLAIQAKMESSRKREEFDVQVPSDPTWTCPALVERHWLIWRPFFRTEPGL